MLAPSFRSEYHRPPTFDPPKWIVLVFLLGKPVFWFGQAPIPSRRKTRNREVASFQPFDLMTLQERSPLKTKWIGAAQLHGTLGCIS